MYVISPLVLVSMSVPFLRVGGRQHCISSTGWGGLLNCWVRIFVGNPFEGLKSQGAQNIRYLVKWRPCCMVGGDWCADHGGKYLGKPLGVKHRQRHWWRFLSLCPGSGSPPLHFVFQLLLVLLAKGEGQTETILNFFKKKKKYRCRWRSRRSPACPCSVLRHNSEECDVDPLCVLGGGPTAHLHLWLFYGVERGED